MHLRGKVFAPSVSRKTIASGVDMVFQYFSLCKALTIVENTSPSMKTPAPKKYSYYANLWDVSKV
jgi:ABC-type uncharacterized transport system ATPase subunit